MRTLRVRRLTIALLAVQTALVAGIAWNSSPNCDELAHLAAGLYHWQTGRFDTYRVNPPLVRLWACLPLAVVQPRITWSAIDRGPHGRSEWQFAHDLMRDLAIDQVWWGLFAARMMCLPFLWLGAHYCHRWASERYGPAAGLTAMTLWCFCPNLTSWGATLCPDVAAAAVAMTAAYHSSRWLDRRRWDDALVAGTWLGLALLTKLTCVVLLALGPARWLLSRRRRDVVGAQRLQGVVVGCLALTIVNLGYGLARSGSRLGDLTFCSQFLAGGSEPKACSGNRFRCTPLADLKVPLPADLILGVDQQKADFERGKRSYLAGQWRHRGWWHYYIVCALVKIPLGFWGLALLSCIEERWRGFRETDTNTATPRSRCSQRLCLLLPPVAVVLLVSSQTGFARHFRYVFPCLPFLYIGVSRIASRAPSRVWQGMTVTLLLWFVASSLAVWPLGHSYFNELTGGPSGGHRVLLDSNLDWGEDVQYAQTWMEAHPNAQPVYRVFVTDDFARHLAGRWQAAPLLPRPGWYLASIHRVLDPADDFHFLSRLAPRDRIGYSTWVYRVTSSDLTHLSHQGLGDPGPSSTDPIERSKLAIQVID